MSGELKSPVEDALEHQPFGALQLRVVLLCAFVQAFDGFDLGTIGMAAPSLSKAWGVPPAQFDNDDQACRMKAADHISYDPQGMGGTRYDQNRAFNAVYSRCMAAHGYRPRPYYRNWLPS